MKSCAFCPTTANKLSREHLWDDWLNEELPTSGYRVKQRTSPNDPFKEYGAKILKEKVDVVCESCNHGWMSTLTNEVKKNFSSAILHGTPMQLSPAEIGILAAFAFMKSVVADHASKEYEPFFSRAARERFGQCRTIPEGLQIWIAAFQGAHRYSGKFVGGVFRPDQPGPLSGLEFNSFTFVCGHLVLQTLACRSQRIIDRGKPVPTITPGDGWNSTAKRIWPSAEDLIVWPPEKYLGDDLVDTFVNRFQRIRIQH